MTSSPNSYSSRDDHTVRDYASVAKQIDHPQAGQLSFNIEIVSSVDRPTSGWSSTPSSRTPPQPACSHSSQAGKHNPLRHNGGRCESPLDYPDDLTDDHVERRLLSGGDELYADPPEKSEH
jgi:hypothetical protein